MSSVTVGLALITFSRAFGTYFGADDFRLIMAADTRGLFLPSFTDFFSTRYLSEIFAFSIARRLFTDRLWAYHAASFVMHLLCGFLVYRLADRIRPDAKPMAWVAAGFFLLHPASYSVFAFAGLGFNEPPVLVFSLVGAVCFLRFLADGGLWRGMIAVGCLPVAAGFKNQAVMIPALYAAFGFLFAVSRRRQGAVDLRRWLTRGAAVMLPCGIFSLWYALVVVPLAPQAQHPAFARNWQLSAMIDGYSKLLYAAINPLGAFREPLGFQSALPEGFPPVGGGAWRGLKLGMVTVLSLAAFRGARRRRESLHWLVLFCTALATMSFAAAMPHHRYEYYIYFALVPFVMCMSYLAEFLPRTQPRGLPLVVLSGLLGVTFLNGYALHRSNDFVRHAENARVGVAFASILEPNAHIHFVRPDSTAWHDQVYGASFAAMLPGANLIATFGRRDPKPFTTTTWPRRVLAYFEPRRPGPGTIHVLEASQDEANVAVNLLAAAGPLTQSLTTHGGDIDGVGILIQAPPHARACTLNVEVYTLDSQRDRRRLATETVRCSAFVAHVYHQSVYHILKISRHDASKARSIHVEITSDARTDGEAVALWLRKDSAGDSISFRGDGDPSARRGFSGATLAYIVTRPWREIEGANSHRPR